MEMFAVVLITIAIGALMPIQSGINGQLGGLLKQPLLATCISMAGGFLSSVAVYLISGHKLPSLQVFRSIPSYLYMGGLCGLVFVTAIIIMVPKYGITKIGAGIIVGQLVFALILDHYALLGMPGHSVSFSRIAGAAFLMVGLFLIHH